MRKRPMATDMTTIAILKIDDDGARTVEAVFDADTKQEAMDLAESWLHGQSLDRFEVLSAITILTGRRLFEIKR
jgi:hypothetical protein